MNNGLNICIKRIFAGSWRFIQLRGDTLSTQDINRGDVDLLGSQESVESLLLATCEWAREGLCHVNISSRTTKKTALSLFSIDGEDMILFDLWQAIPQIQGTRHSIEFKDFSCLPEVSISENAIIRLPVELECLIYFHHLAMKNKNIKLLYIQERLRKYRQKCAGNPLIIKAIKDILITNKVSGSIIHECLGELKKYIKTIDKPTPQRLYPFWLRPRKAGSYLSVMGCDGVGKTSLCRAFIQQHPAVNLFTGKHLYRKCYIYKLGVIFIRPLTFKSRENFDEIFPVIPYLRASLTLFLKHIFRRNHPTIIDRNLIDFLCINRKTDTPRWSKFYFVSLLFGRRIATVHCVADFDTIKERKLEITKKGHYQYDRMVSDKLATRVPTEYTVFNNNCALSESLDAFQLILSRNNYHVSTLFKVGQNS